MCKKLVIAGLTSLPPIDQRPTVVIPIIAIKVGYKIPMYDVVKDHSPYYQYIASDFVYFPLAYEKCNKKIGIIYVTRSYR